MISILDNKNSINKDENLSRLSPRSHLCEIINKIKQLIINIFRYLVEIFFSCFKPAGINSQSSLSIHNFSKFENYKTRLKTIKDIAVKIGPLCVSYGIVLYATLVFGKKIHDYFPLNKLSRTDFALAFGCFLIEITVLPIISSPFFISKKKAEQVVIKEMKEKKFSFFSMADMSLKAPFFE